MEAIKNGVILKKYRGENIIIKLILHIHICTNNLYLIFRSLV